MSRNVLQKLGNQEITASEAYLRLNAQTLKVPKARFIKLRIWVKDQKAVSVMLNTIFAVPLPLAVIKPFTRRIKDPDARALIGLIHYAKGTKIHVDSKEAQVAITVI